MTSGAILASLPDGAIDRGDVDADHPLSVVVYFHDRDDPDLEAMGWEDQAVMRTALHRADFEELRAFAAMRGIAVSDESPLWRRATLQGSAATLTAAFGAKIRQVEHDGRAIIVRTQPLAIHDDIADIVLYVAGFDQRPILRSSCVEIQSDDSQSLWPIQVALNYGYSKLSTARDKRIGICSFGSGYSDADTVAALTACNLPTPQIHQVMISNPQAPDWNENALDVQVIAALAPDAASITLYMASNDEIGMQACFTQSVQNSDIVSCSWVQDEDTLYFKYGVAFLLAVNDILKNGRLAGTSFFTATGDYLSVGEGGSTTANAGFPATSPNAIAVGGTQYLEEWGIQEEVVWSNPATSMGTGGGISEYFPIPPYQTEQMLPLSIKTGKYGRGIPDIAAIAGPYTIVANGQVLPNQWGTSASAPLWAALYASIEHPRPGTLSPAFHPRLYANFSVLPNVVSGNNYMPGTQIGYPAGPGWNACSGLGIPNMRTLWAWVSTRTQSPSDLAITNCVTGVAIACSRTSYSYPSGTPWVFDYNAALTQVMQITDAGVTTSLATSCNSANVLDLFYLDADNQVQYVTNGSQDRSSPAGDAYPGTKLAVVRGNDDWLTLFYQDAFGTVHSQTYNNSDGWLGSVEVGSALKSTHIAAIVIGFVTFVYFQRGDGTIVEYQGLGGTGWQYSQTIPFAAVPMLNTGLAVIDWGPSRRLYAQATDGTVVEMAWEGSRWSPDATMLLPPAAPRSPIAAVSQQGGKMIRLYYLSPTDSNPVTEQVWADDLWRQGIMF